MNSQKYQMATTNIGPFFYMQGWLYALFWYYLEVVLIKPKVRGDIKHVPTLVTEQQFLVTCYLLVIKT